MGMSIFTVMRRVVSRSETAVSLVLRRRTATYASANVRTTPRTVPPSMGRPASGSSPGVGVEGGPPAGVPPGDYERVAPGHPVEELGQRAEPVYTAVVEVVTAVDDEHLPPPGGLRVLPSRRVRVESGRSRVAR
jgi:hypothetical protein